MIETLGRLMLRQVMQYEIIKEKAKRGPGGRPGPASPHRLLLLLILIIPTLTLLPAQDLPDALLTPHPPLSLLGTQALREPNIPACRSSAVRSVEEV